VSGTRPPLPNTPSLRDAQFKKKKHRDYFSTTTYDYKQDDSN